MREGTEVEIWGQVVGHERVGGRSGEVLCRGTARLDLGCIEVETGFGGSRFWIKKWMDIEFIIRYFKKKS